MAKREHISQAGKCDHQCAEPIIECQLYEKSAGVMHLPYGCEVFANDKHLKRHNNVLKVLMTTQTVEKGLLEEDLYWQKPKQKQGTVTEIEQVKMCGYFEYKIRKETTAEGQM